MAGEDKYLLQLAWGISVVTEQDGEATSFSTAHHLLTISSPAVMLQALFLQLAMYEFLPTLYNWRNVTTMVWSVTVHCR